MSDTSIFSQSGVIPYRISQGSVEVLLITSRRGHRWVVPKGIVEPHLSARQSAKKEALEEAGIEGTLARKSIGSYTYEKWSGKCTVEVFPMHVEKQLSKWQEEVRKRRWFSVAEAASRVDEKKLKLLIREVGHRVSGTHTKS